MFNKLPIKLLLRENARLRREIRRKDQVVAELLDKFVHNRIPQRLQADRPGTSTGASTSQMVSSYPSDAYSQAIEDAERIAAEANYLAYMDIDEDENDD